MIDGTLTKRADGSHVVTFDRVIPRTVSRVWAALTDPAILKNWLGEVYIEPRVGGRYDIHFREMTVVMTGKITAFEPERLLEYSWLENYGMPGSMARWELSREGDGCRLKLIHSFPPECIPHDIIGFLGGWQAFLDVIAEASDGVFVPYRDEKALDSQYRAKYLPGEPADEHGTFSRESAVTFERVLPGPIERVWQHLTEPEKLSAWFGKNSAIEPRAGGGVRLIGGHIRGTITQWRPPHALTYTWNVFAPDDGADAASAYPESYLTITLEPRGSNVVLHLKHLPVLERFEKQNAMGWHTFLDILGATLRGEPVLERKDYMTRNAARYGVDLNNLAR